MWAFSDNDSWIPDHTAGAYGQACIYNIKYQPKPAYFALLDTLRAHNGVNVGLNTVASNPFSIVPTLVGDCFIITSETGSPEFATATITDITGKKVVQLEGTKAGEPVYVSGFNKGIYVLILTDHKDNLYTMKFLKK
jgi:hypothetical protein